MLRLLVFPEFGGIEHLPDSLEALLSFESDSRAVTGGGGMSDTGNEL